MDFLQNRYKRHSGKFDCIMRFIIANGARIIEALAVKAATLDRTLVHTWTIATLKDGTISQLNYENFLWSARSFLNFDLTLAPEGLALPLP